MADRQVHWPAVLPDEADATWLDLRSWVELLVARFSLSARVIPPCWFRHNAMVEALSALHDYERASFAEQAPMTGGVDFLRALREIEYQLGEWISRSGCSAGEHHDDAQRTIVSDEASWEQHVADDVAGRARVLAELDEGVLDYG